MSTKVIIGTIVGGFIIFIWQTLSWTMLNIHGSEAKYTENQDSIMNMLSNQIKEDGSYYLPGLPPKASSEEEEKYMSNMTGKPWATISYHKSWNMSMGMNMFRGLLADIVAVWMLMWLLMKIPNLSVQTSIMASLAVGLVGYLTTEYAMTIWFQTNSIPSLIDAIVGWVLCGTWLGWWINKN
ncbi:MAG: hypothetical protein IPO92_02225 [Saprospiraceae bacterium]|nr:hypothetical protein [Saprospiraceae bacterium]